MGVRASTAAKQLNMELSEVLELAGKPDGSANSVVDLDEIKQKKEGETPSKPRRRRSKPGARAAAKLIDFLRKFVWPDDKPFPADLSRGRGKMYGTTVDQVRVSVTYAEFNSDLARGGYGIPLFHQNTANQIVTYMADLLGAPKEDSTDAGGQRIFINRKAWYYYMLHLGEKIWAKELRPPGLDVAEFPEYKNVPELVWRWRSPSYGFVARAFEAFLLEAGQQRGTDRRKFEREWVEQFVNHERSFRIGDQTKTMDDFTIKGRAGKPEEFQELWSIVRDPRQSAKRR